MTAAIYRFQVVAGDYLYAEDDVGQCLVRRKGASAALNAQDMGMRLCGTNGLDYSPRT